MLKTQSLHLMLWEMRSMVLYSILSLLLCGMRSPYSTTSLQALRCNAKMFVFITGKVYLMDSIIYLIRHCQAKGQERNAPLTELGKQQAIELANLLEQKQIEKIVSSPYTRAYESIVPLAKRLTLTIETDERLIERLLSPTPVNDWENKLAETFVDLDLSFNGGESSRTAMSRGMAVVNEAIRKINSVAIVTHGNLMALILKSFDERIGYDDWSNLQNPDVYCLGIANEKVKITRFPE